MSVSDSLLGEEDAAEALDALVRIKDIAADAIGDALEVMNETANAPQCVHHWHLPSPDGPTVVGKCCRCDEEREFTTAWPADSFSLGARRDLADVEWLVLR